MYCKYCGKHHLNKGLAAICLKRFEQLGLEARQLADVIGKFLKIPKRTDKRWRMSRYLTYKAMGHFPDHFGKFPRFPDLEIRKPFEFKA